MKAELCRLHKKIANQRNDFHWKLANKLCGEYAVICMEDLNLKGMQKLYGRKISDLGFAEFLQKLEYVAYKVGTTIIKIDRFFPSSQLCSCCGQQKSSDERPANQKNGNVAAEQYISVIETLQ